MNDNILTDTFFKFNTLSLIDIDKKKYIKQCPECNTKMEYKGKYAKDEFYGHMRKILARASK